MNTNQVLENQEGNTLPDKTVPADLIRFDKNLASNGLDFANSYQEDGQLIFDLLFYIALTYQKDLFNFGKIIPNDFADAMGYNRYNLLKKHPKPAHIFKNKKLQKDFEKMEKEKNYNQKLSNGEYPLYTVLDNALFRAGKENLIFSYEVKNFANKEKAQGMTFIPLLSDVKKHYSEKNNNKIYYTYKLSTTIEAHLSKYFMLASATVVKQLRQQNSVFLYLYLKNLQQSLHNEGKKIGTPFFNLLCDIAEINITAPKLRKQKLIKKLSELREKTDLKFDFRFNKGKGRFEYNIEIEFHANTKAIDSKEKWGLLQKAIEDNYGHRIKNYFLENIYKKTTLKWEDWSLDNKYNLKEKMQMYWEEYNNIVTHKVGLNSTPILKFFNINRLPDQKI